MGWGPLWSRNALKTDLKNKAKAPPAKGKATAKAPARADAKGKPAAKPQAAKAATGKDSKKVEPVKPGI